MEDGSWKPKPGYGGTLSFYFLVSSFRIPLRQKTDFTANWIPRGGPGSGCQCPGHFLRPDRLGEWLLAWPDAVQ
jgi:hypothetical protein